MKIYAPAKVNLSLDVVKEIEGGYHDLDMIMAPISLYNEIQVHPAETTYIRCQNVDLPQNNAMTKMLKLLKEKYDIGNYSVEIQEEIPMQAGLVGASANAAAVLRAVDQYENLHLSQEEMIQLGVQVGADVPFCLVNRMSRVKGIGEKIEPMHTHWRFPALLIKPEEGVSTPAAFDQWNKMPATHPNMDAIQATLEQKDLKQFTHLMGNSLEAAAMELVPILKEIHKDMDAFGLRSLMTGSGSTIMGFGAKEHIEEAYAQYKDKYPFVQIVTIG